MKSSPGVRPLLSFGAAAAFVWLTAGRAESQRPELDPYSGTQTLKSGFKKDHKIKVTGGVAENAAIHTNLGGVKAWVSESPDFKLNYVAGDTPFSVYVQSKGDTTLLIQTPDGKWVANDDGGKGTKPYISFPNPKSGQYTVWVGTYNKKNERGMLVISEKK